MDRLDTLLPQVGGLTFFSSIGRKLTRPIFCTNPSERVYITAWGCEIGSGRRNGLQAPGAGGL